MNEFIQSITSLDPIWVYVAIFFVAYIENLFPPAPSDILVVFGGAIAAMGKGHFVFAFIAGATGGTLGFMTMFTIGKWFGNRILEQGKIKFIKLDDLHKFEKWFTKWGFWLIAINRFLTGTRAVVSFFAGVAELDFTKTTLLSLFCSMLWYAILVFAGYTLGHNWQKVSDYLKSYSIIVTIIFILVIIGLLIRYYKKRRTNKL